MDGEFFVQIAQHRAALVGWQQRGKQNTRKTRWPVH
jgi:hypothetical protein